MPVRPSGSERVPFYRTGVDDGRSRCLSGRRDILPSLYSNVVSVGSDSDNSDTRGALFNLEFSKDGKLLVAACEKRCIAAFSSLTHTSVFNIHEAHAGYVNCVKFLDGRMFASCSDDNRVAVWDVRNLRHKVHCLQAHSNWVKNIEYVPHRSLLVTSGFDGSIYTWDLNNISVSAERIESRRVLHTNGLMRTSLSPDFSKMVVCNNKGYIMVVHDVDFDTMPHDLRGFKPSLYRLMQISRTPFPSASVYKHLFDRRRKRNRIEFITDFPPENVADMITSLAMHPFGWCVASRNTSGEDASEWTCVHDIQDLPPPHHDDDEYDDGEEQLDDDVQMQQNYSPVVSATSPSSLTSSHHTRSYSSSSLSVDAGISRGPAPTPITDSTETSVRELQHLASAVGSIFTVHVREPSSSSSSSASSSPSLSPSVDDQRRERRRQRLDMRQHAREPVMQIRFNTTVSRGDNNDNNDNDSGSSAAANATSGTGGLLHALSGRSIELRAPSADVIEALRVIREHRRRQRLHAAASGASVASTSAGRLQQQQKLIVQNTARLTHFIEEPHPRLTLGFIKELCFSADGRVLCSPFGHGVRLLGFNERADELSHVCGDIGGAVSTVDAYRPSTTGRGGGTSARRLCELATTAGHERSVVAAKFSPVECLLVTGCLGGRLVWHRPRF